MALAAVGVVVLVVQEVKEAIEVDHLVVLVVVVGRDKVVIGGSMMIYLIQYQVNSDNRVIIHN